MTDSIESTTFGLGFNGNFALNIVPKVSLTFSGANDEVVNNLSGLEQLHFDFPIEATHRNVPDGTLCNLTWLVQCESDDSPKRSEPIEAQVLCVDAENCKIVDEDGNSLKLNVFEQGLIGKGQLGYSVQLKLPHTQAFELSPSIDFDVPISLELELPSSLLIGSTVTLAPKYGSQLDKARFTIKIIELDEAEGEFKNEMGGFVTKRHWDDGDRDKWSWKIGFSGESMAYMEPKEAGDFEYAIELSGATGNDQDFHTLIVDKTSLVGVKKPRLAKFVLQNKNLWDVFNSVQADEKIEPSVLQNKNLCDVFNFVQADGKIEHLDPQAGFTIQLALVNCDKEAGITDYMEHLKWKTIKLEEDGSFSELMDWRFELDFCSDKPSDVEGLLALLKLPSSIMNQDQFPICNVIEIDDTKHTFLIDKKDDPEVLTKNVGRREIDEVVTKIVGGRKIDATMVCSESHLASILSYKGIGGNTYNNCVDIETDWAEETTPRRARNVEDQNKYNDLIMKAGKKLPDIDLIIFKALIAQESGFNPKAHNNMGYAGLTQCSLSIFVDEAKMSIGSSKKINGKYSFDFDNDQRFVPEKSILGGLIVFGNKISAVDSYIASYVESLTLIDRYKMYLAAYNAGQGTIQKCIRFAKAAGIEKPKWEDFLHDNMKEAHLWLAMSSSWRSEAKYKEITHYVEDIIKRVSQ